MMKSSFQKETLTNQPVLLLMAEILRSPVEVGSLSRYLQGFIHSGAGCLP